jgi:stage II sporulation protein D
MTTSSPSFEDENADEMEAAAALSAVLSCLTEEQLGSAPSDQCESVSLWQASTRLKSCGLSVGRLEQIWPASGQMSLWQASNFKYLPCLFALALSLLCSALPADARPSSSSTVSGLKQDSSAFRSTEKVAGAPGIAPTFEPVSIESSFKIRVALLLGAGKLTVTLPDGAELKSPENGCTMASLPADSRCTFDYSAPAGVACEVQNAAAELVGQKGGQKRMVSPGRSFIVSVGPEAVFGLGDKLYRGALFVCLSGNGSGLNAVNLVDLEEYLLSVVPAEMPGSWPPEALKAQSIAARSYAVANLGKHEQDGFDLNCNAEDQVYNGVAAETHATNQAVADTAGLVLKHDGRVISAFFHSTSGGYTELAEHVWGRPVKFLKSVPDYDDTAPFFTWTQKLTPETIEQSLRKNGYNPGDLLGMYVLARAPTARVRHVMVVGSQGVRLMGGDEFRRLLSLPSSNFNVGHEHGVYLFAGRGHGHGLGLSQWGARTLAENGYNAAQILTYYYKDVSLDYL